eukprot:16152868-Heterocapsa_arctica.AAC.1
MPRRGARTSQVGSQTRYKLANRQTSLFLSPESERGAESAAAGGAAGTDAHCFRAAGPKVCLGVHTVEGRLRVPLLTVTDPALLRCRGRRAITARLTRIKDRDLAKVSGAQHVVLLMRVKALARQGRRGRAL